MGQWPPVISIPTWIEEGNLVFDESTQTVTVSGALNLSSTGSLKSLNLSGYNGNSSVIGIIVISKATGNSDTYQLQGSNDNSTWFNVDDPFLVTTSMVTASPPISNKAWNRGQLAGFNYYRVNVTLDVGTLTTTVQAFYQLSSSMAQ